jgi:hypothetical protein
MLTNQEKEFSAMLAGTVIQYHQTALCIFLARKFGVSPFDLQKQLEEIERSVRELDSELRLQALHDRAHKKGS